jgi:hypothetical protein
LIHIFLCAILLTTCGKKKKEAEVPQPVKYTQLKDMYIRKLSDAKTLASPEHGWVEYSECDGMLWAGKYLCGGGTPSLKSAEYPNDEGRFNRRPSPYCGEEFGNSKTTWSRDMGMGLLSGAWCARDRDILERHASYGTKKNWIMGEPFADGRVVYTPSIIGILYQTIYSLGGADTTVRKTPSIYSSGLDDYQAHLQMLDIWLRGETTGLHALIAEEGKPDEATTYLDISSTMWERVKEHSDREPECPFYQYLRGIYDGSLDKTTDLLLASESPKCQYVRGGEHVPLIEWLFTAKLTLKKSGYVE